ncbi:unannotated protein [freshwater metagenome]|uniref:Unannotated protein n=1 Tax=freshwater metagenome TaxID=449393 RepID=A0A6J6XN91_9ZZZZ
MVSSCNTSGPSLPTSSLRKNAKSPSTAYAVRPSSEKIGSPELMLSPSSTEMALTLPSTGELRVCVSSRRSTPLTVRMSLSVRRVTACGLMISPRTVGVSMVARPMTNTPARSATTPTPMTTFLPEAITELPISLDCVVDASVRKALVDVTLIQRAIW